MISYAAEKVVDYIGKLQAQIVELGGNLSESDDVPMEDTTKSGGATESSTSDIIVTIYDVSSGVEDYEKAGDFKQQASDARSAGDYDKALEAYNQAVLAAPPIGLAIF